MTARLGCLTILFLGCSVETSGLLAGDAAMAAEDGGAKGVDASGIDASTLDAGETAPDGGDLDGGAPTPDSGETDAGPPDAGPRPCAEVYARPTVVCAERDDACEVYAELDGRDCDAFCGAHGSSCAGTWDNHIVHDCMRTLETRCDIPHSNAICICRR